MTCAETRDLFSALADDALSPAERGSLDAHLADCAECRRELASLLRTVKLVRALDPAHAPDGFVDRVLAAAQPAPWPTRLAQRFRVVWALPASAAALLLIAGLAVLLFRASPEQQRAARSEPPATSKERSAAAPPATAQDRAAPPSSTAATTTTRERAAPSATSNTVDATNAREGATAPAAPAPAERARAETPVAEGKRADAQRELSAPARDATAPRAAPSSGAVADARSQANIATREATKDEADRSAETRPADRTEQRLAVAKSQATPKPAPVAGTAPIAGVSAAEPDVTAQLRATNVGAAERSIVKLAARVGARQTGRRIAGDRVIVDLAVPREAYADFVRGVAELGAVAIDRQTTERSVLAVAIAVAH